MAEKHAHDPLAGARQRLTVHDAAGDFLIGAQDADVADRAALKNGAHARDADDLDDRTGRPRMADDYAYIDREGGKHLPIENAERVRSALRLFADTHFESLAAAEAAWHKILTRAQRFKIRPRVYVMPVPKIVREPAKEASAHVRGIAADVEDTSRTVRPRSELPQTFVRRDYPAHFKGF